jgi:hypothetical protein
LRSSRKPLNKTAESPAKDTYAGGTPKRNNTAAPSESGSTKKVDFTPSTKSCYAVKLAAASPSSSKLSTAKAFPSRPPVVPFNSAAYTIAFGKYDSNNDEWEDVRSEVDYPVLLVGDEVDYPIL